ncbi:MAG: hypothetical protein ACFFDK_09040 [Promethearchaeota archaeon]
MKIQSIASPDPAMKPSKDIVVCHKTIPADFARFCCFDTLIIPLVYHYFARELISLILNYILSISLDEN